MYISIHACMSDKRGRENFDCMCNLYSYYRYYFITQAMMKDQFANYVVQKVLETCSDQQRELILSRIKVHLDALKKYTYGKHIVARVEKLVAAGGTHFLPLLFHLLHLFSLVAFTRAEKFTVLGLGSEFSSFFLMLFQGLKQAL